jgi:hypothetical protein
MRLPTLHDEPLEAEESYVLEASASKDLILVSNQTIYPPAPRVEHLTRLLQSLVRFGVRNFTSDPHNRQWHIAMAR